MGVGLGDYDLDGHTDHAQDPLPAPGLRPLPQQRQRRVRRRHHQSRPRLEQRFISWGCGITDLDNDGYPDILIVCGTVYPELEKVYPKYPARDPRLVFRNRGDGTFVELGEEAGPGISAHHQSRGCAFGDFDNDGDLDVLILNQNEPPSLLRNDAPSGQSLDQSAPRRRQEQPQRHRRPRGRALRRQESRSRKSSARPAISPRTTPASTSASALPQPPTSRCAGRSASPKASTPSPPISS